MNIDNNETEKRAMAEFHKGNREEGSGSRRNSPQPSAQNTRRKTTALPEGLPLSRQL